MSNNTHAEIIAAGAFAAFTVDLLVYPLDTIKTRLQSQDYVKTFASSSKSQKSPAFALRGLYQGVGIVIATTLPAAGVFFTVYESSKTVLGNVIPSGVPQPLVHSMASGIAELSSCLVLTPAEVIKQNAQMIRHKPEGSKISTSLEALRMIRNAEGGAVRRLWTGYTALAARNLPFTAIQFPIFESFRARLWRIRDQERSKKQAGGVEQGQSILETGIVNGISAAGSGIIAAVITTPTDVVKTRMMLAAGRKASVDGKVDEKPLPSKATEQKPKAKRLGSLDVAKQVYKERGLKGLFRGGALRAGWTAVGSGLYLGTYEAAKVWLRMGQPELDEEA